MAGRADIKAGGAYVELSMRDNRFLKGLRGAMAHLASTAKGFAVAGAAGIGAAAAIGGVALKAFMDLGDELDKMRQRTGLSVETLSELQHAAEQSGASLGDVENGVRKMQKELGKAGEMSKESAEALKQLGLSAGELKGMSPEQQFNAISKAVGKIADPTKRAAMAMQFFGKSGTKLLPMIEDLEALRQEARDLGFVMSGEGAANAVKLGDKLANLWKTVRFGAITLGEVLAPAMIKLADVMQPVATATLKWMQSIRDAILGGQLELAGQIAFTGLRIVALKAIATMSDLVGGAIGDFLGSIGTKMAGGDFAGAWGDAVAGMLEVWSRFSQAVVEMFAAAANGVINLWQGVEDKITDFLLKNASEGGIFGKLAFAGSGIDLQAEAQRAKRLEEQARAAGAATGGSDFLAQAQETARGISAGRAEKLREAIDAMRQAAELNTEAATRNREEQISGGATRAQEALAAAQAELAALKGQINKQAQQAGEVAIAGDRGGQVSKLRDKVAGTFSAAAAMALGQGGSVAERQLREAQKGNKTREKQLEMLGKILKATGLGGLVT